MNKCFLLLPLGPHSVNLPGRHHLFSVGQDLPGVSTKLDNLDKDGNGEVSLSYQVFGFFLWGLLQKVLPVSLVMGSQSCVG